MIAVALLAWAALLALAAPGILSRAAWVDRAPRLAIACWQALSMSTLISLVGAGLALAAPTTPFGIRVASVLQACWWALRHGYATPGGVGVALAGLVLAAGVAGRAVACLATGLTRSARQRRSHRKTLRLVGHSRGALPVVVIDHAARAVYCVPGITGTIVVTSAALDALDPRQLDAVIAHERAHLSGHHHLLVGVADAWRRAFPRVPLFQAAHREITRLVELAADDTAAGRAGRLPVAAALAALAGGAVPAVALAAGGAEALGRVRRLLHPPRPLGPAVVVATAAAVLLAAAPVAAAGPALIASHMGDCQHPMSVAAMSPACARAMPQRAHLGHERRALAMTSWDAAIPRQLF